jgi:hypothetical protein
MRTPDHPIDRPLIQSVAVECRLPADLLEAQVVVESSGDPFAFRYEPAFFDDYIRFNAKAKGARYGPFAACSFGLLQILLETALEDGFSGAPEELFVPRIGLLWGARHLELLLYGWAAQDVDRALAAYNGGKQGNASRPFRNHAYVQRVRDQLREGTA